MKPAPPEASSDLARARALSELLLAPREAVRVPTPSDVPRGYARLGARHVPLEPGARWPRIVAWARQTAGARAALAIDRKGLLVAADAIEDDEAVLIGGRVAMAFDHARQIERTDALRIEWSAVEPGAATTVLEIGEGEQAVLLALVSHRGVLDGMGLRAAIERATR